MVLDPQECASSLNTIQSSLTNSALFSTPSDPLHDAILSSIPPHFKHGIRSSRVCFIPNSIQSSSANSTLFSTPSDTLHDTISSCIPLHCKHDIRFSRLYFTPNNIQTSLANSILFSTHSDPVHDTILSSIPLHCKHGIECASPPKPSNPIWQTLQILFMSLFHPLFHFTVSMVLDSQECAPSPTPSNPLQQTQPSSLPPDPVHGGAGLPAPRHHVPALRHAQTYPAPL